jgi:hypothetical protein
LVLLGVLSIAALVGAALATGVAFGAGSPPVPTVTSGPDNPTNQTSASFAFTDSNASATFLCALDGAAFAACTSPTSYPGPLAAGDHSFKVQAKVGTSTSSPTEYRWKIDLTPPPAPVIGSKPANPTSQTSATFDFSNVKGGVTYLCKLDGGVFTPCPDPQTYPGPLGAGSHTFSVEARDPAGNIGPATSYAWTIDVTPPPAPAITSAPADPVSSHDASFGFSDGESGVSFVCKLDAGSFTPCTSPKKYTGVADGSHTFYAAAVDGVGNQSAPASFGWMVDTTPPPAPSITAKPANPTNQTAASFSFTDSEASASFLCSLDNSEFAACTTPQNYTGPLVAGSHMFKVEAKDTAGNVGPATSYTWTIDLTPPPAPSITAKPANPTNVTSPNFGFTDSEASATFLCKLDGSSFAACSSPQSYAGPLSAGSHTFSVEAKDTAGNVGPATSYTWTIDLTPPAAPSITSGPPSLSSSSSATFAFSDTEAGVSFVCQLDIGVFATCTSPKNYSGVSDGSRTFYVAAVDAAGNMSSPASYTWTVDTTPPPAPTITVKPANPTNHTAASFEFTDTDGGATFLCKLDGGSFAACSSPQSYPAPLSVGSHTFSVEAKDAVGNVGPATSYTWTVDLTPPPAPSITAKPANPTNDTSPSFSFTDSEASATFLCKLDGGSFAACPSPQTYPAPLSEGSHAFSVEAKDAAGNIGPATSYTWTIDTSPPTIILSFPADGGSYNASGWNAGCAAGPGICGTATDPSGVAGAGVSIQQLATGKYWNGSSFSATSETFNAGTATGGSSTSFTGRYPLALPAGGSYTVHVRAADNLGNTTTAAGQLSLTFTIDTVAPPAPVITGHPSDPDGSSATFSFTDSEAGVSFECKLDGAAYAACSSPQTYSDLAPGSHTFSVRAKDAAGNLSGQTSFTWTATAGMPFQINGTLSDFAIGIETDVPVTITNPNSVPIHVTSLTFTVTTNASSGTCDASNFAVTPSSASMATPFTVPANATDYAVPESFQPKIKLIDLPKTNQDNCKGKGFTLNFTASAHS